jgi:hypothetical protein
MGLGFHFATVLVVLAVVGMTPIGLLTAAALLLYMPALLWSLGGLDTPVTIFAIVVLILFDLVLS